MANEPNTPRAYRDYSCEDIAELVGAYSIGATTPAESRAVEAMLPRCPDAAAELADYLAVADAMLHMLPADKAPPANLLDDLHLPDAAPQFNTHTHHNGHVDEPLLQHSQHLHTAPQAPQLVPMPAPAPRPIGLWVALAAMFVVVLGMGAMVFLLFQGMQEQRTQIADLLNTQQDLLTSIDDTIGQTNDVVTSLVDASEAAPMPLSPGNSETFALLRTDAAGEEARGRVIWNAEANVGSVWAAGLPTPPSGHSYEVWLVRGEGENLVEISLGRFTLDEDGQGSLLFQSPLPLAPTDIIGISTEPDDGGTEPTTPHLVIGQASEL